jgi:hypothetical protein
MRPFTSLCVLGLLAASITARAADDPGLPPLITGKDTLNLTFALGARYDSNPDALHVSVQPEYDGSATAGAKSILTIDALDRIAIDGDVEALESNRDQDRREILGAAAVRFNRIEELSSLVVDGQFSRADEPYALTGSRVVTDTYRADARYEWNDERNTYAINGDAALARFQNGVDGVPVDDLDSDTVDLGISYGRKLSEFDSLTLRLTGQLVSYQSTGVSQDSDGLSLLGGWASQLGERDSWTLEAGVEVKHYRPAALAGAYTGTSPTVRVTMARPWLDRGQLVVVLSENLASSVFGNPAIVSTGSLDANYPLGEGWTGRCGVGVIQVRDTHSNDGQPKDLRSDGQLRIGSAYLLASGLTLDLSALYEVCYAHVANDYRRVGGQLTLTQVF